MYRGGDRENHSYVLGAWSSEALAMQAGDVEALWRGDKYKPEVTAWNVDANEYDNLVNAVVGRQRPEGYEMPTSIEILEMIVQDMADDAKNFDGKPFTGRTVAEYFGNQGAAIAALANIVKLLVESRLTPAAPDARPSTKE